MSSILGIFTQVINMFKSVNLPLFNMSLYDLISVLVLVWVLLQVIFSKFFKNIIHSVYENTDYYEQAKFENDVKKGMYRRNVNTEINNRINSKIDNDKSYVYLSKHSED